MVRKLTFREYLIVNALLSGADIFIAIEAVSSSALEHPEWNLDEERTWEEWETA